MRQELKLDTATVASQDLCRTENEILTVVEKGKGIGLSVKKVADGIQLSSGERPRMRKHKQMMLYFVLITGDGVILLALLELALIFMPYRYLGLTTSVRNLGTIHMKLVWSCLTLMSWLIASGITNTYDMLNISFRFRSVLHAIGALMLVFAFWMVFTTLFLAEEINFLIKIGLFFFTAAIFILSGWRILFAKIMCLPHFRPKAVILGTTTAGRIIAKELHYAKQPFATILGYISEDADMDVQVHEDELPILGDRSILHCLAQSGMIDMIVTAVDYHMYPELFKEVIEIARLGISVVPMPIAYENASGKIPVEHIGDQWYLALPLKVTNSLPYLCWCKAIDVIFGLVGTAVLFLALPILALLIYLDSPGSIFYSQERIGLQGKPFRIYKFRSMRSDAEDNGHAVWATVNDARVTRIGRFMRATHLDELPQVLNILQGDMGLIGPRPEREELTIELEKTIPFYRCRLAVKPGLTGWAQVNYHYASTENHTLIKLQYDLYYIKHRSFTIDVFIVLKTFAEVFMRRGM